MLVWTGWLALEQMIETVGAVAQLGEHLLCKQGVSGSIPLSSTILVWTGTPDDRRRPLALRSFASFEADGSG